MVRANFFAILKGRSFGLMYSQAAYRITLPQKKEALSAAFTSYDGWLDRLHLDNQRTLDYGSPAYSINSGRVNYQILDGSLNTPKKR